MSTEHVLPFSVVSVVEDVLQQGASKCQPNSDFKFASRKAEEASLRRYEAAGWLRKTVGVVGGKDLPAEPSEEAFRIGLRSGIILCNALNKIQPGAVAKVVEGPSDSVIIPDGAALSAFQYFENVRNFLVAVEEIGLPTFEASDLEQGGKSSRIVNCVLALKSHAEGKLGGRSGSGSLKYGQKPPAPAKPMVRKNSEPFMKSLWSMAAVDKDGYTSDNSSYSDLGHDRPEGGSFSSLNSLVRQYLSDKKPEEIPIVVESLLNRVMEEFERRMQIQQETQIQQEPQVQQETLKTTTQEDNAPSETEQSISKDVSVDEEMEEKEDGEQLQDKQEECCDENSNNGDAEESNSFNLTQQSLAEQQSRIVQQSLVEQQNRSVQEVKNIVLQTKSGMKFLQKEYQKDMINLSKHLRSLAAAASGYHKVLDENRKLYNQVQDLKGNIRVYCRVRPFLGGQASQNSVVCGIEEGSMSLMIPPNSKLGKEGKKTFNFNKVFGSSSTQGEVFADTQPLIRSVLDGYNVCIFAYGQTGSGKTYTMAGPDNLDEDTIGVNYRALRDLFFLSDQRKDTIIYEISVQMLEIYNEQVRDLLAPEGSNKRLEIRNSSSNGINVPEANLVPVSTTSEVINLMNLGHKNRAVGSTAMNDRSSRSHSCLTVHVHGKNFVSGSIIRGCMHLVDLAGSERADKTEATGDRLKEAQHINKSLSALGDVIASLAQKNAHVPYRNSKLTQLLQDALGGQAKTLMFVHMSPEPDALGETLSTLKFAERVSSVELGAARVNKDNTEVKDLKEQIAMLKAALARKDGEAEHVQQPTNSSPVIPRLKSYASSPPMQRNVTSSGGRKLPKDDSSSIMGQKKSASKLKRRSLDPHDMYRNSLPWPHVNHQAANGKEDDKESVSGEWVDKIRMNRTDSLTSDDSLVEQWEADNKEFSPISPSSFSENSKLCLEPAFDIATMTTEESDELEIATSDSSESDMNWLIQAPKPTAISNGLGSIKAKKSINPRPSKIPEIRSMIPSLIPTPSKKLPIPVIQARKNQGSIDAKRRNGNAK
ncbi:kinesin-like protein KIN-14G isoform X2 [Vicia villosa]|uniref:kinesin-like protein KIN-14G isoform X2 n=1 Tax=Vicia villosa TaxID=3911 RepID=UPI00273C5579|nr:kinesin-like protein KIN-14G isoform X2 [Vicia villosa]